MGVISAIRSLALTLILFVGLLVSHHLGGGSFSFSPYLIPIFILSFSIFWTKPVATIRGPYLALLLLFIQVLGHFGLAANADISTLRMTSAHLTGITLSYILACNFDKSILALFEILRRFFKPAILLLIELEIEAIAIPIVDLLNYRGINSLRDARKRGPPSFAVDWR